MVNLLHSLTYISLSNLIWPQRKLLTVITSQPFSCQHDLIWWYPTEVWLFTKCSSLVIEHMFIVFVNASYDLFKILYRVVSKKINVTQAACLSWGSHPEPGRRAEAEPITVEAEDYTSFEQRAPSPGLKTSSPVWAHNEWDPLEEVIVGRVEGATIPVLTPEVKVKSTSHFVLYIFGWN